jgi:hypothetical protein
VQYRIYKYHSYAGDVYGYRSTDNWKVFSGDMKEISRGVRWSTRVRIVVLRRFNVKLTRILCENGQIELNWDAHREIKRWQGRPIVRESCVWVEIKQALLEEFSRHDGKIKRCQVVHMCLNRASESKLSAC